MKITREQVEEFFGNDDLLDELVKVVNGEYTGEEMRSDILDYFKDE